jgi:DNA-binding CsgD family transcriptional regulator
MLLFTKEEAIMKKALSSDEHGLPSLSLVFGYIAVKELQRLEDRVSVLARLGYGNAEIATICNTTSATVKTLKSAAKKKPRKALKRRKQ